MPQADKDGLNRQDAKTPRRQVKTAKYENLLG
jgi:hypothetical protein